MPFDLFQTQDLRLRAQEKFKKWTIFSFEAACADGAAYVKLLGAYSEKRAALHDAYLSDKAADEKLLGQRIEENTYLKVAATLERVRKKYGIDARSSTVKLSAQAGHLVCLLHKFGRGALYNSKRHTGRLDPTAETLQVTYALKDSRGAAEGTEVTFEQRAPLVKKRNGKSERQLQETVLLEVAAQVVSRE